MPPASFQAPATVVIAKWDRLCGDALKREVERACNARAVLCQTAAETLRLMKATSYSMLLMGVTLPDMDGLDLLHIVTRQKLVSRILVVSGRRDEHVRHVLKSAPISGFFDSATESTEQLGIAIEKVFGGGTYFSRTLHLSPPLNRGSAASLAQLLTPAEMHVFAVIGDGSDDDQAADRLGIKATTAHCHRQRIMRKLGVQTRVDLMRAAIQRGVVRFTTDRVLRPGAEACIKSPIRNVEVSDAVATAT